VGIEQIRRQRETFREEEEVFGRGVEGIESFLDGM